MKILIYITGYRHLIEYKYFNNFLRELRIKYLCDIFIYCNNAEINNEIMEYYRMFEQKNKQIFITTLNGGYRIGGVEAISEGIDMGIFKGYDYVIHLHPDVFITDDLYLIDILLENKDNDTVFLITKSKPDDDRFFSFDFFIFKPKKLENNIFKDELYTFMSCPEHYLHDMIMKNEIKYKFIKRFNNNNWYPRRIDENLKLYHEHDMNNVVNLLKERSLDDTE